VRPYEHAFVLNVNKETLEKAGGFDKDDFAKWLVIIFIILAIITFLFR
jgi:hypothetical protein